MNNYTEELNASYLPHLKEAYALNETADAIKARALQTIKTVLGKLPHKEFILSDYLPDYTVVMADGREVPIRTIFLLSDNTIVLQTPDEEDFFEEDDDWTPKALPILTDLMISIDRKINDLKKLKVGAKVRWNDPAIDDYDPDDREEQLELIWVIDDCPSQDELDSDSTISISNEYGEAEVLPWELVYVDDGE